MEQITSFCEFSEFSEFSEFDGLECRDSSNFEPNKSNANEFGLVNFVQPKQTKTNNFKVFLEEYLGSIIKCPIIQSPMARPVVASDGFIYEASSLKQLGKHSYFSLKSPITREKLTTEQIKIPLINSIIEYGEKYNLEVCKDRYINEESFDDIFDDICSIFKNGNYDQITKINKFILDHTGTNGQTLCQIILSYKPHNDDKMFAALCHVFNNVENINININGMNILHYIARFTIYPELFNFVIGIIRNKFKLDINSFNVTDYNSKTPIDYLFDRGHPALIEVAFGCGLQIHENLTKYVNTLIRSCNNTQTITTLISKLNNKNEFYDNMSPLFTAIKYKKMDIINHLVSIGVNLEHRNSNGVNAIHYAVQCSNSEIALNFLDKCSDLEEEANDGWKLIHMACYYCPRNVIDWLLDRNVKLYTLVTKFKGNNVQYLPLNLIELNGQMSDMDRESLIDFVIQLTEIQRMELESTEIQQSEIQQSEIQQLEMKAQEIKNEQKHKIILDENENIELDIEHGEMEIVD